MQFILATSIQSQNAYTFKNDLCKVEASTGNGFGPHEA